MTAPAFVRPFGVLEAERARAAAEVLVAPTLERARTLYAHVAGEDGCTDYAMFRDLSLGQLRMVRDYEHDRFDRAYRGSTRRQRHYTRWQAARLVLLAQHGETD